MTEGVYVHRLDMNQVCTGKRWNQLLITAVLFSTAIEAVQYALNLGWCEIDDVICNVLGAAAGFGLWKLIKGKMHAV